MDYIFKTMFYRIKYLPTLNLLFDHQDLQYVVIAVLSILGIFWMFMSYLRKIALFLLRLSIAFVFLFCIVLFVWDMMIVDANILDIQQTIKINKILFSNQKFIDADIFNDLHDSVEQARRISHFKDIVYLRLDRDTKQSENMKESVNNLGKFYEDHVIKVVRELQARGERYGPVYDATKRLSSDFKQCIEELLKTMSESRRFYQKVVNGFEAIIEAREAIKTYELLLFLRNVLAQSTDTRGKVRPTFFLFSKYCTRSWQP